MIFIIMIALVIYFVLIAWTWHSLGFIEKNKKVTFILIGIILMYLITLIIFQITKSGIQYPNIEMQKKVQNVLVSIFAGINGIIVMPQIGKLLEKIKEDEIKREELTKKLVILLVLFGICVLIEVGYLKDTQQGILKIYHAIK